MHENLLVWNETCRITEVQLSVQTAIKVCLAQGFSDLFWTTDNLLHGFSLADHQNIRRNILRICNGMRVKFSQQLHYHDSQN
jgi:hypothetical protein